MDRGEFISLSEAAALSGMTRQHLSRLIRKGLLPARRVGKVWVITRTAVLEYLGDAHKRSKDPLKDRR